ncbi:MAG TPA: chaperone modulator CbpM [Casimicrobiaceae bacterium]|nr:chaperone modulator CbpM [Casimicrobiaceae bacterium]
MDIDASDALYLDEAGTLSLAQLIEYSGLSDAELRELVECGALAPADPAAASWTFSTHCIVTARVARRLREDFALEDVHSLALVLRFVQRIELLEQELRELRARRAP